MTRMLFYLVREVVHLAVQVCLMLLGLVVRLIYWTVQAYGWAKVGAFAGWLWGLWWLLGQGLTWVAWPLLGLLLVVPGIPSQRERSPYRYTEEGWSAPGLNQPRRKWLSLGWRRKPPPPGIPPPAYLEPDSKPGEGPVAPDGDIANPQLLRQAWERVKANGGSPGPDRVSIEWVSQHQEAFLSSLQRQLQEGRYRAGRPRFVQVPKSGGRFRVLAILNVADRVVQNAVLALVEPLLDALMAECSYAFRKNKGTRPALAEVERLLPSHPFVVKADVDSAYDGVVHQVLFSMLDRAIPDQKPLGLLKHSITAHAPQPGLGLAQGDSTAPMMFNVYLTPTDLELISKCYKVVRYADDLVILCSTRAQAEEALATLRRLLAAIGLRLSEAKTRIVHRDEGFEFLGYQFDAAGKRPSPKALEELKNRLESAPDDIKRKQILAGWRGYFGDVQVPQAPPATQPSLRAPSAEPFIASQPPKRGPMPNSSQLQRYAQLFLGRTDHFARHWNSQGRSGYLPVRQNIGLQDLQAHLSGEAVLGTYLLQGDTTRALIFDIDGPDPSPEGQQKTRALALKMAQTLRRQGIAALCFDSGGKGHHLWLCFAGPVKAAQVRQWAAKWLDGFRPYPQGVMVEVFPKQNRVGPGTLGSLIRLPLGLHPETKRPSYLLSQSGEAMADPWEQMQPVNPEQLLRLQNQPDAPTVPAEVVPLTRCGLIRALVEKASHQHDLGHTERLALLYTVGKAGEAGASYLHQVMACCSDYDPQITGQWLGRLEEGHRSIRCSTLKDWLKDYLPEAGCECQPHPNPSPVDLLRREAKYRSRPPTPQPRAKPQWKDVLEDIFDQPIAEDDSEFPEMIWEEE